MASPKSLFWEDVAEGDELPPLTYELSLLRMVAFIRATGLYDYIHFDGDYARSAGMRDAFISTPHIGGLFTRLATEWSGPQGEVRSLSLRMTAPCYRGEVLTARGKVGRKYVTDAGEPMVELTGLTLGGPDAPAAMQATLTLALPTRDRPVSDPADASAQAAPPAPTADTPDFARDLIGQVKPAPAPPTTPLTPHEIMTWCEALEDWNPLYCDEAYARTTRHGGVIAPPAMGVFFGSGASATSGVGVMRPGVATPEPVREGLTGLPLLQALRRGLLASNNPFALADFPEAAVGQTREDFHRPVQPGDSLTDVYQLLSISPLKTTRAGEGHFVTFSRNSTNQRGERVKTWTMSLFMYRAAAAA